MRREDNGKLIENQLFDDRSAVSLAIKLSVKSGQKAEPRFYIAVGKQPLINNLHLQK